MFEKHLRKKDILTKNVILPQVFLKYFSSRDQLPVLSVSVALVENGLSSWKHTKNNGLDLFPSSKQWKFQANIFHASESY